MRSPNGQLAKLGAARVFRQERTMHWINVLLALFALTLASAARGDDVQVAVASNFIEYEL